jgi:hypothetical protein
MAAVTLAFTWLGVRKTLAPEQRTTAARAFHADHDRLGLRPLAGLAGVLGRDQRGGVTTPKTDPGTVSTTVSKRPLGAEILRRAPRAVPEEFVCPRYAATYSSGSPPLIIPWSCVRITPVLVKF